jgi:xylulokinase
MSLMGVDIGSSRCKAVVFRASGGVVAEAVADYRPEFPGPSMVEMNPDRLWDAVASAIRRAASQTKGDPIEAIGLGSHGETFVPTDERGEALGPAIMNADNRATAEAAWWEESVGRKRIFEITGLIVHPMYPMAKLAWLRRHRPDLFRSAARFVSISDYVLLKLGLEPCIAYPLACRFMAFDVRELRWSEEILNAAELSAERMSTPVPAGTAAGRLSRTAARELELPAGVPVVVGGHDQPCGALGMGATAPGMVSDSIGTYECLAAVGDRPSLGEAALRASLNSYCHVVPDQYITIAYFPSGLMVKWFCDTFCSEDAAVARRRGQDLYEYLEGNVPTGPTGLCILPHLIGSSNPHFDARATGVIFGLVQTTNRYQIYKGILEGLACELAIIAEMLASAAAPFDTIRCTGGGARSKLGLQLRATMTGRKMQTLRSPESVCLGAALLAGVSAGAYGNLDEGVRQAVDLGETFEPDGKLAAAYEKQMRRYRLLYPALEQLREV